jgi:hypothetical protein
MFFRPSLDSQKLAHVHNTVVGAIESEVFIIDVPREYCNLNQPAIYQKERYYG